MRLRPLIVFGVLLVAPALFVEPAPRAQEGVSDTASLEERLDRAEAELIAVQRKAESVEEQIATLDQQRALVSEALATAEQIEDGLRSEIRIVEKRIRRGESLLKEVEASAEAVAVELYKGGTVEELDRLLSQKSLVELDRAMAVAEVAAEERTTIMVTVGRLADKLDADRGELRSKLAAAKDLSDRRRSKLQHLRELRAARTVKLSKLGEVIDAQREEARSIAARSEEVASLLDADTPTVTGSSGFMWPISGPVTSGYGPRWGSTHTGIDIDCSTGATIRASKGGAVVTATYDDGYGYHIVIDHGGGLATLYAHNSDLFVAAGRTVAQGEPIAACGSTGQSTGDHLHFEVRANGSPVDPMGYLP